MMLMKVTFNKTLFGIWSLGGDFNPYSKMLCRKERKAGKSPIVAPSQY